MKLLELFQRLDELRVRYKSPGKHDRYDVVSHRGNVWLVGNGDPNSQKVALDIHNQTGLLEPESDFDEVSSNIEERPDIIYAVYSPDESSLWMGHDFELGHHPRASAELKKLVDLLNVDFVQGNRIVGQDEQEVSHSKWEMEGRVPDELYHGTDVSALPDILRFGLVPGRGESNWEEVGQFDMVFLAADWHKAAYHAVRQEKELNRGAPVILKVKIPDRSLIEPDFDAITTLGPEESDTADRLGYSGSGAYHQNWNVTKRQNISDFNPGADNLPLISGVVAYRGRIPASHIQRIDVDLRGEMGDSDELEFTTFRMPQEYEDLRRALDIYSDYGYWYPGIESELEHDEDDEDEM